MPCSVMPSLRVFFTVCYSWKAHSYQRLSCSGTVIRYPISWSNDLKTTLYSTERHWTMNYAAGLELKSQWEVSVAHWSEQNLLVLTHRPLLLYIKGWPHVDKFSVMFIHQQPEMVKSEWIIFHQNNLLPWTQLRTCRSSKGILLSAGFNVSTMNLLSFVEGTITWYQ